MREIKFRIWDIHSHLKCYSNQYSLYCANGVISNGVHVDGEKKRYIAQQFTGLYDKNGKEIYEGDILFFQQQDGVWPNQLNKHIEVKYPFVCSNAHLGEIIGNIFETPELLK